MADLNKAPEIEIFQSGAVLTSGSTHQVGTALVGATLSTDFTIKNVGSLTLKLSTSGSVTLSSAAFSLTSEPGSLNLAAGEQTQFTVQMSTGSVGSKQSTLTIFSDDADEAQYIIYLQGNVVATATPEINLLDPGSNSLASGGAYDFGSVNASLGSAGSTFTIQNTGLADLNLTGSPHVEVTGTDSARFVVGTQPASTINGSGSSTFTLTFNPGTAGVKNATMTIASNDADENPYTVTLTGTGTSGGTPEINIKQGATSLADGSGSIDVGARQVNTTSAAIVFTIENTGIATLNLTSTPRVQISGTHSADFILATDAPATVGASSSVNFEIEFKPTAVGLRSATVSVANNDSDENPYTFTITGNGQL